MLPSVSLQKKIALYDLLYLKVYLLTSKLPKYKPLSSKWKEKSFQAGPEKSSVSI